MFQCPVCGELVEALTNIHCVARHQTTKQDLIARFGTPRYVMPAMNREIQRWVRDSLIISRMDFEVAQAAARNQMGRKP